MKSLLVSVIIPTYNRKESVLRTLNSLSEQTLSTSQYEVIVVDDGSSDDTTSLANQRFPFVMHYVRQENQGATIARNQGVLKSQGDVLVFIDDDVTVSPQTLESLAEACSQHDKVLVMGTLLSRSDNLSVFTKIMGTSSTSPSAGNEDRCVHFTACNTELLSIKRSDFLDLGMLQDPTDGRGWPNWDDVDFGYRAHLKGFRLLQNNKAIGEHWDYSMSDWGTACRRWQRASKSAVLLFKTHPGLQPHIPMLYDKTPIVWGQDSLTLIARKVTRHIASSKLVLGGMGKSVRILEQYHPSPEMLRPLYRWLNGGYMFRGYREGLREFGPIKRQGKAV